MFFNDVSGSFDIVSFLKKVHRCIDTWRIKNIIFTGLYNFHFLSSLVGFKMELPICNITNLNITSKLKLNEKDHTKKLQLINLEKKIHMKHSLSKMNLSILFFSNTCIIYLQRYIKNI